MPPVSDPHRLDRFTSRLRDLRAAGASEDAIVSAMVARFGALTLHETGLVLGVNRERARQIEAVALLKLKTLARFDPRLREWRHHG